MQPFKKRESKKRKGKKKKRVRETSTELLLGIYLTKLNEVEAEESGGGGGRLTSHPLSSTQLPAAGAESECDQLSRWLGTLFFFFFLFFFGQYSKTSHSSTDHRRHTLAPPPPPAPPSLSPMVLSFQLTKHLTRQSRRMHTGTGHEPDEGRWGKQKKKQTRKKKNQNQLIMNFAKDVFKSLVPKSSRWQPAAWRDTVWIEQASIFKSGGERRLARRCHGNQADLDLSVLTFPYVLCWLFSFHVWSRAGNFLFLFCFFFY